jgi:hypothetical protein
MMLIIVCYLIKTRKLEVFCVLLSKFSTEYIAVDVSLTSDHFTFLQFQFSVSFLDGI